MSLRFYRLDSPVVTIVLASRGGAPMAIVYWGPCLRRELELGLFADSLTRAVPHGMLDDGETFDLFPETGRGFLGRSTLSLQRADGRVVTQMRLENWRGDWNSVALDLEDRQAGVTITQRLRLDDTGVLSVSAQLQNVGDQSIQVHRFAPAALPCPFEDITTIGGRWTNEFKTSPLRLKDGAWISENRTGRTSHHAPPFLVAGDRFGVHLGWSGDCDTLVERLRDGRMQIQMAQLLQPGEVVLAPGETFETATLYAAKAPDLDSLRGMFHRFVETRITSDRYQSKPRPVHLNTWEACYFAHDLGNLKALADSAAALGVERFVLDDGWFKGRRDDTAGLGDWTPDPDKYPHGLAPLADHVRSLGMEFGLWVEPECANADSDLLRAHPDWILHEPGRAQPLGRGQFVLDLTRAEVSEAIFAQIDAAIRAARPSYLKWDYNRDLSHAVSLGKPAGVRQVKAVYALMDRLRVAHPALEIEACASGGARADYAMLSRAERFWLSDCNDPFDRQRQQRAFSIFFPPATMGSHVGPARSHTTGRITRMDTRAATALFGHMGVEADVTKLSQAERETLAFYIRLYKELRAELHQGLRRDLPHPDDGLIAFSVDLKNGQLLSVAQVETAAQAAPAPLPLKGLDAGQLYEVRLINPTGAAGMAMKNTPAFASGSPRQMLGAVLMEMGLALPVLRPGDVALFRVKAV
jgi:alpha-galactosidase